MITIAQKIISATLWIIMFALQNINQVNHVTVTVCAHAIDVHQNQLKQDQICQHFFSKLAIHANYYGRLTKLDWEYFCLLS
jgi:hypothetical protein